MANIKISALPAATSAAMADLVPVVQSGVTKKSTFQLLADLLGLGSGKASITNATGAASFANTKIKLNADGSVMFAFNNFTSNSSGDTYLNSLTVGVNIHLNHDGSASFANLIIAFDADGTAHFSNDAIILNPDGSASLGMGGLLISNVGALTAPSVQSLGIISADSGTISSDGGGTLTVFSLSVGGAVILNSDGSAQFPGILFSPSGDGSASFASGLVTINAGGVIAGDGSGLTNLPVGQPVFTSYASGTAYTMTNSSAQVVFGTISPAIVLNTVGTYLLFSTGNLKYNGATYAAAQTATLKLRRINNTAADLTNATRTITLRVATTLTDNAGDINIPFITYVATAGDIIQMFGSISATPSVGSIQVDSAEIIAIRIA